VKIPTSGGGFSLQKGEGTVSSHPLGHLSTYRKPAWIPLQQIKLYKTIIYQIRISMQIATKRI
jgi:hypothetical protein